MNKLMMSLLELIKELYMVEGILKDLNSVHMAVNDSSDFSRNKKKKARVRASVSSMAKRTIRRRNALIS